MKKFFLHKRISYYNQKIEKYDCDIQKYRGDIENVKRLLDECNAKDSEVGKNYFEIMGKYFDCKDNGGSEELLAEYSQSALRTDEEFQAIRALQEKYEVELKRLVKLLDSVIESKKKAREKLILLKSRLTEFSDN